MQDPMQLQQWLDKHGSHVGKFQLYRCTFTLARLSCAQLQDLLLHGVYQGPHLVMDSGLWSDIAAATKLTSVQLDAVSTTAQQADVVSALTALPDLEQLTWREVVCGYERELSDSRLLWQLTKLTSLELHDVAAEALQHLSLLTKLQHLSMHAPYAWAAADYPGLQELQRLTNLVLKGRAEEWWGWGDLRFPACVSHLTALQELEVSAATAAELNALTALTPLTKLHVAGFNPSSQPSAVLRLPALQHLNLNGDDWDEWPALHISYLASCTQLRYLSLGSFVWTGPGSLVASSMLQELDVWHCSLGSEEDGPAAVSPWERLFPGPGRLPHLTSLVLRVVGPEPQQAGIERLVECCSGLRVLRLDLATDEQCSSLAQLTGLQDLHVSDPRALSAAGLRHLAGLEQLTSLQFLYDLDSSKVSTVLQEQLSDSVVDWKHAIVNKAPDGCPPDVSARLLRACDMMAGGGQQQL